MTETNALNIDILSLPAGASPDRDRVVGWDELGNPVRETIGGVQYAVYPVMPQNALKGKGVWDRIAMLGEGIVQSAWNGFMTPGRAAAGEPVTYGDVLDTAGLVQLGAAAMPAPKNALRSGALASDETYIRRNNVPTTPDNGVGYSMFARGIPDPSSDDLSHYGQYGWTTTADGAVDAADIQKDIVRSLYSRGAGEDYGTTAANLARGAVPENIVDSAGIWDNPSLVSMIWDDVLSKRGITKVRTPDGLILFDPSQASRYLGLSGAGFGLGAMAYGPSESDAAEIRNYLAAAP